MDGIHKFMNIVIPIASLVAIALLLPPYLVFKLLSYAKRSIFSENVAGKVVLITGASSGIGQHLAYEYARRGARLALAARREDRLRAVADEALKLGSPDVLVVRADISKVEDCRRFVDEAVQHFGQLDHLVNNAGIPQTPGLFEDCTDFSRLATVMDINFWGSLYCTRFAVQHLRKSKGKIVVVSSVAAGLTTPRLGCYNASKAALISFYETLRAELHPQIGVTIVTPGLIQSEITTPGFLSEVHFKGIPIESAEGCAKAIVKSACRGDTYLTEPSWAKVMFLFKLLFPEVYEWYLYLFFTIEYFKGGKSR